MIDPRDQTREQQPIRIWALHVPFNKRGFPVFGHSFAAVSSKGCIIIPADKWTALCQRIPELAATQFEVGTLEE